MVAMSLGTAAADAAEPGKFWVFVGTYTDGKSKGIYRMVLDTASGKLSEPALAAELENPSFLAVHPTAEIPLRGERGLRPGKGGGVTSFALDPKTGELTRINQQSTVGDGPCHLVVDATGKNVLVANYGGGSVAVLPIGPDGKLGPASDFIQHTGKVFDPKRQGGPHAHSINLDKANRFAVVADLGLDRVFVYKFDPIHGKLDAQRPARDQGQGPLRPAPFRVPSRRQARLCDQRNQLHGHRVRLRSRSRHARRRSRRCRRCPSPSSPGTRPPRSWSTRRVSSSTAPTAATTAWPSTRSSPATGRLKLVEYEPTRRQDPAQLRRRSDRLVRPGREHGLRHDRRLPRRSRDRCPRADGPDRRGARGLLREVRPDSEMTPPASIRGPSIECPPDVSGRRFVGHSRMIRRATSMETDDGSATGSVLMAHDSRSLGPKCVARLRIAYGRLIHEWCRRCGLQEADAEDVTQEVLKKLYRNIGDFKYDRGKGTFLAWLKTVTRNAWRDFVDSGDNSRGPPWRKRSYVVASDHRGP